MTKTKITKTDPFTRNKEITVNNVEENQKNLP